MACICNYFKLCYIYLKLKITRIKYFNSRYLFHNSGCTILNNTSGFKVIWKVDIPKSITYKHKIIIASLFAIDIGINDIILNKSG